jgi:hypothetical protein
MVCDRDKVGDLKEVAAVEVRAGHSRYIDLTVG